MRKIIVVFISLLSGLALIFLIFSYAGVVDKQVITDQNVGVLYLMLAAAMFGGFVGHLCRNNGGIVLPTSACEAETEDAVLREIIKILSKVDNQVNVKLGVFSDILIGLGSGMATLFLLETEQITFLNLVSWGFIAGFLGQSLIQIVTDKVQSIIGLTRVANLGSSAYRQISAILRDMLEVVEQIAQEGNGQAQHNLALKYPEIKSKIASVEALSKSREALLSQRSPD